ncbi:MAG TPA: hypothetical protein VFB12_04205, partial [Ktedonobacteraceae bacterium]|nr:hypothetical protein [Ktedonobacteraceae bacterium]
MAATFLMVLMIGGLTSLLLLANGAATTGVKDNLASIVRPAQVAAATYQTTAPYPHVASAVANRQHIYYTTYSDNMDSWMLEAFDNQSKLSSPVLPTVSTSPLIVLGSSQDWLVWLQLDPSKSATGKRGLYETESNLTRTWSLHALYQGGSATQDATSTPTYTPITLHQDTFNPGVTSAWVHTPIQGVWLTQDTLFVTMIDAKGVSHLWSYQLDSSKAPIATEIATAEANHILTSPTATSDNTDIYWSEEWITDKNVLSSNIWTQQTIEAQPEQTGRWAAHAVTEKYLFRSDGLSFRPQIVQNTLFFLKATGPATNDSISATPGATSTTTARSQATATKATSATTPAATVTTNAPAVNVSSTLSTTRVDPTIYTPPLDESVQGTLLAFSANGALPQTSPQEDNRGLVSAPQGGSRFLLWQNSTKTFGMYDAVVNQSVNIGTTTVKGAAFVAVNGDTAVWVLAPDTTNTQATGTSSTVTFGMFSWPPKAPANQ